MTAQQIRDEVMTLFLAGHETTANALAWTFYLLCRNQDAYARAREEARSVLAGRVPTVADLPKLPFSLQCLKESMRLYPPAYIVGRAAEEDLDLAGHPLAKGSVVMVNIFGIHHRGDYFADPESFRPERFAGDARPAAYLPFGGGARVCIGNHFAMMEGHLILAHLLQKVAFTHDGPDIDPEPLVTLRPQGGLPVRVTRL
jgi:cytochrome P450